MLIFILYINYSETALAAKHLMVFKYNIHKDNQKVSKKSWVLWNNVL
jgi:hypothetical protein